VILSSYAHRALLACFCVVLSFGTVGCKGCSKGKADKAKAAASAKASGGPKLRVPVKLRLTEAQQKAASALAGKAKGGSFPTKVVKNRANAPLFLYLAASSDDPKIIAASLKAMASAFASADSKRGANRAGREYAKVVAAHLKSKDPAVVAAAIRASRRALAGKRPPNALVGQLVALAERDPQIGTRIEALQALRQVSHFQRRKDADSALLAALKHESPALQSTGLSLAAFRKARELRDKPAFLEQARALMKSPDPGVRGRAAVLAAYLGRYQAEVYEEVAAMLEDEHPCARSYAVTAFSRFSQPGAIHRLIKLVDDMAVDQYDTKYKSAAGKDAAVHHNHKQTTVHDRVISALTQLSSQLDAKFEPAPPGKEDAETSRKANAAAAKAWYAKNKAKLPKDEPPKKPEKSQKDDQGGKADQGKKAPKGAQAAGKAAPRQVAPPAAPQP